MIKRIFHLFFALITLGMANGATAAEPQTAPQEKFVFHITDNSSARGLLNNARNFLDAYDGKPKLVVVANGGGVDFLLQNAADKDGNPYNISIEQLQERGVEFRVCNNTLRARKIDPKTLLEGVQLVPAGIVEVARLASREGYVYIKP
jgi:hypothetical protein